MNEYEAAAQGFTYSTSWRVYNKHEGDTKKSEAAKIKKKYNGADYRIVTGSAHSWLGSSSKAIYGNEIYQLVRWYTDDTLQTILERIDDKRARLLAQLADLNEEEREAREKDARIKSLLKK